MKEKYYAIKDCGVLTFTDIDGKEINFPVANGIDVWNSNEVDLIAVRYQITDDDKEEFFRNFYNGEIRINFEKKLARTGLTEEGELAFKNMSFQKREFWLDCTYPSEFIIVFAGGERYVGNSISTIVKEFLDVLRRKDETASICNTISRSLSNVSTTGIADELREIKELLLPTTINNCKDEDLRKAINPLELHAKKLK